MTRQIVFKVTDEISDELFQEMKDTLEFCLHDLHDEIKMEDGIIVPRLVCCWCADDITRDQAANQDELCNDCYQEQQDDEDDYA